VEALHSGAAARPFSDWQRDDVEAGRLRNEPEQGGCVVFESGLVLLVPRQKTNTVPSLATNLCYGWNGNK
jgi:hypothetical protein